VARFLPRPASILLPPKMMVLYLVCLACPQGHSMPDLERILD
jgi:hypothetical protein